MTEKQIDMSEALRLLGEAAELCKQLDGEPVNVERVNNKAHMAQKARRSRELQYASHLVGAARVAVDQQFHRFKGDLP